MAVKVNGVTYPNNFIGPIPQAKTTTKKTTATKSAPAPAPSVNNYVAPKPSPEQSVNDLIRSVADSLPKYDPSKGPKFSDYFNEALVTEAKTKQYEPYYTEMLGRYVTDQTLAKTRLQQDTASGLSDISTAKDIYTQSRGLGERLNILTNEQAIRSAEQGFAGRGLTFSGIKNRGMGELRTSQDIANQQYGLGTQSGLNAYGIGTRNLNLTQERGLADIGTAIGRKQTDVEREKKAAIASSVLGEEQNSLQRYGLATNEYQNSFMYPTNAGDFTSGMSSVLSRLSYV